MARELIVKNYFYFFTAPPVKPVANHAQALQMDDRISSAIMIKLRGNAVFSRRGNGP
jgi:hypothetical protein